MELSVLKPGSGEAETVSVSDTAFAREYNEALVHQVVTAYMAGARQGTRAQKSQDQVSILPGLHGGSIASAIGPQVRATCAA